MDGQYPDSIEESVNGAEPAPQLNPDDFRETPEYSGEEPQQPQQPQQQEEQPQSTGVIDAMRERGYEVGGYEDDEALIKETEARYAAAVQAEREQAKAQLNQGQYASDQPQEMFGKEAGPQAEKPGRPDYDPAWAELVEQDPAGRFVVRQEYVGSVDPSVAEHVNKYVEWRQNRSNQLIDDPVATVMQAGLQNQIQSQINSSINNAIKSTQTRSQAENFITENADTLYVQDPKTGKTQVDGGGNPVLSPVGRALNDAHVMLRKQGMTDPASRHQVATQMVQNYFTQQQLANFGHQQQQQPQQSQADQYKDQYTEQPFAQPTNPLPPGYMPNTPAQPQTGLPEHTSLGSLATALAVHKGYLQPK